MKQATMSNTSSESRGPIAPSDPSKAGAGVYLTERAIAHVKRELAKSDTAIGFRIAVKKTGCSGWMYAVELTPSRQADDEVFSVDDTLDVFVDRNSLSFLRGTEVDFIQEGLTRQLKFNNPNVTSACGCGESFSID